MGQEYYIINVKRLWYNREKNPPLKAADRICCAGTGRTVQRKNLPFAKGTAAANSTKSPLKVLIHNAKRLNNVTKADSFRRSNTTIMACGEQAIMLGGV
jgi:hypothetical protein